MTEGERIAARTPPVAAIFVGAAWITIRPRVLAALPKTVQARIRFLRYQPDTHFENAFRLELQQVFEELAGLLDAGSDEGISVLLVGDPQQPGVDPRILQWLEQAMPTGTACSILQVGCAAKPGAHTAVELSNAWRGRRIQGGALEEAVRTLLLALLATTRSRFRDPGFPTFSTVRFGAPGQRFLCAVEGAAVPDFRALAAQKLEDALTLHYIPQISPLATRRAQEGAHAIDLRPLLRMDAAKNVLELQIAERLLCAAVSTARYLAEVSETLTHWQAQASESVRDLLTEWILSLQRWQDEAASRITSQDPEDVAVPLFQTLPFPPLTGFVGRFAAQKARVAWDACLLSLTDSLAVDFRSTLDAEYSEFLPRDWGSEQVRRAITGDFPSGASYGRAFATRHFPPELLRDWRDEILHVPGRSITLYWLELA